MHEKYLIVHTVYANNKNLITNFNSKSNISFIRVILFRAYVRILKDYLLAICPYRYQVFTLELNIILVQEHL